MGLLNGYQLYLHAEIVRSHHMVTTMGPEAGAFLRDCEAIHFLLEQGTSSQTIETVIEVSMTDLRAKLEMYLEWQLHDASLLSRVTLRAHRSM